MVDPSLLRFSDLRESLDQVLVAAEAHFGSEVTLDVDYYWHLPVEEAFDMTGEPTTLTVGQVVDDLEKMVDTREQFPHDIWHDLSHLIGILRALELAARS